MTNDDCVAVAGVANIVSEFLLRAGLTHCIRDSGAEAGQKHSDCYYNKYKVPGVHFFAPCLLGHNVRVHALTIDITISRITVLI